MTITQANRFIAIKTPLGPDKLLLESFSITQELGRMFQIEAELASEDADIDFDKVVGHNVTIRVDVVHKEKRYFNGFVSRLVQVANRGGFARYHATIVPWIWFLTRTSDCRIFQKKTIAQILKEVFDGHGFSDFESKLGPTEYQPYEYCVQYRETDFNFVSRLMEEEGIYYFFKHEDGKHTLVLADSISDHAPTKGYEEIAFDLPDKGSAGHETVTSWAIEHEVQPVAVALNDYDFTKPKASLKSSSNVPRKHGKAEFEIYDYPGVYNANNDGDRLSSVRLEELQTQHKIARGRGDVRGLEVGHTFKLKSHPRKDQNTEYLITGVTLNADAGPFAALEDGSEEESFICNFTTIEKKQQFRPERLTPEPIIQGTQTAVVVGPPGETIHTDKFGRIKVQFHWDRYAKGDDNASCWIRVSQNWGGKDWGGMFVPHVGQEVIVSFEEGDPDRPLITGRVYNPDQMPPVALPGGKTKSAIRDHGGNEIIMEGVAGKQQIRLFSPHANTKISMGFPNSPDELSIHTDGNAGVTIDKDHTVVNGGDKKEETKGKTEELHWGPFEVKRKSTWREMTVGTTHETFVGAKSDLTVGTLVETRLVNHTEIKGGSHFELKKAWHVDLDKVGKKHKSSKLQELIEEHEHYTKKRKAKIDELTQKIKKKKEEVEDLESASKRWKNKISEEFALEAKKMSQKVTTLEGKADKAKLDYANCSIDCTTLKLC